MKYMCTFLSLIIIISSLTVNNAADAPEYETPVIVKTNGLQGNQHAKVALNYQRLRAAKNAISWGDVNSKLRSDLVRGFTLAGLKKWVKHFATRKLDTLSSKDQLNSINEIRTMSIHLQNFIHSSCGRVSELLKLLHLKVKEINAIDEKIRGFSPKRGKKQISAVSKKTKQLQQALKREKKIIQRVMKQIQSNQKKLIKALAVYDKGFVKKNKTGMQNLLTSINLQLKPQMSLPYFKSAYRSFITFVLSRAKDFSRAQLNNYQMTAKMLIDKYWKVHFEKAKAEWEKMSKKARKQARKKGKKFDKMLDKLE